MQLFSHIIGSGQPLLILHGLFGMSDNWMTIGKHLAHKGFGVHLIDMRNHGRSPHAETHSYEDMCGDILTYLAQEKLKKVSIIGHSMGGKAAMYIGLQHPAKLINMVIVDIAPSRYPSTRESLHTAIIDHLMDIDLSACKNHTAVMTALEERLKNRTLAMFLAKNIRKKTDTGYAWKLNLPILKKSLAELHTGLEKLDRYAPSPIKTLFIKGNNSDYIKPQHEQKRMRYFPNSNIVGIDNAGHWLHTEQPDRTLEVLIEFLTQG